MGDLKGQGAMLGYFEGIGDHFLGYFKGSGDYFGVFIGSFVHFFGYFGTILRYSKGQGRY